MPVSPLACPNCHQLVHFETRACPSCAVPLGFDPLTGAFLFLAEGAGWRGVAGPVAMTRCANATYGVCNWLIADADADGGDKCRACRHNRIIPDLTVTGMLERWRRIEDAKRRMIWGLIRLGLPIETKAVDPKGLAFDFLYDPSAEQGYAPQTYTGHDSGLITLNLIEADDVARERMRREMGEPYRTLVGHFRHEVGHHYWQRLVENTPDHEPFRALFGDERADYGAAIQAHYGAAAPTGWEDDFVSSYATVHPWEDFAETFAHFLHIVDTLATMAGFGTRLDPPPGADGSAVAVDFDPYTADTAMLAGRWIPFAFALNAVNRSMGQPDLYPFRLAPGIALKLDFINRLCAFAAGRWAAGDNEAAGLRAMMATLPEDSSAAV